METIEITCEDNGKTKTAEVLHKSDKYMKVVLEGTQITLELFRHDVNKAYVKIQKKIHPDVSPETSRLSSIVNEAKDIVLNDIS